MHDVVQGGGARDVRRHGSSPDPGAHLAQCMNWALHVYKTPPISEMTNDQLFCAIGEVDSFFGQPEWRGLRHTLFKLHCQSTEDPSAFTPSFDQLDEWVKDKWWYDEDNPHTVLKATDTSCEFAYQQRAGGRRLFLTERTTLASVSNQ